MAWKSIICQRRRWPLFYPPKVSLDQCFSFPGFVQFIFGTHICRIYEYELWRIERIGNDIGDNWSREGLLQISKRELRFGCKSVESRAEKEEWWGDEEGLGVWESLGEGEQKNEI